MYKVSIVLSILCMPLVSFGMESSSYFSHVGALRELHPSYFNHTEFLDTLPQQETQSIANAGLQPMQECDVVFYQEMAQEMDSVINDYALQETAHAYSLSPLLVEAAQQLPFFGLNRSLDDEETVEESIQSRSQIDIVKNVCPPVLYNESTLKRIQARYERNKTLCPLSQCKRILSSSSSTANHVAAKHYICLFCEPPLDYKNLAGIEKHFTQKHPGQSFAQKRQTKACEKCGKVMKATSLKLHVAICKGGEGIRYTPWELEELKIRYMRNEKQCALESCSASLGLDSDIAYHAAAKHSICLLCEPPLDCANKINIQQHFKQQHPSAKYAVRNRKIACKQCGKEILATYEKEHLRTRCKR